ncbi:hypothetical protein NC99_01180 [Sunxiuqinia dokdonensis]|uniref:Uncharacterized protein n=1 Tax=Sunxiuqinia dokdonensis TaxID=1409788 RepID=A0A0L8VF23_9BACT|nr:hypothetical protein NC99_01180 [Sunxiuqinia dokdonensis]
MDIGKYAAFLVETDINYRSDNLCDFTDILTHDKKFTSVEPEITKTGLIEQI